MNTQLSFDFDAPEEEPETQHTSLIAVTQEHNAQVVGEVIRESLRDYVKYALRAAKGICIEEIEYDTDRAQKRIRFASTISANCYADRSEDDEALVDVTFHSRYGNRSYLAPLSLADALCRMTDDPRRWSKRSDGVAAKTVTKLFAWSLRNGLFGKRNFSGDGTPTVNMFDPSEINLY